MDAVSFQSWMSDNQLKDRIIMYCSGKKVGPVREHSLDQYGNVWLRWWNKGLETFSFLHVKDILGLGVRVPSPSPFIIQATLWFWERD